MNDVPQYMGVDDLSLAQNLKQTWAGITFRWLFAPLFLCILCLLCISSDVYVY